MSKSHEIVFQRKTKQWGNCLRYLLKVLCFQQSQIPTFVQTTTKRLFSSYMLGAKSSTSAVHGWVVRPQRNQIYNQLNFLLETAQLLFQTRESLAAFLSKLSQLGVKFSYLLILFFQSALQVLYALSAVISISCYYFVVQ